MNNLITDIDGLKVGNATDLTLKSGTTALLCDRPMIASCMILGGAPGTRDTDLLSPEQSVQHIDGLVLSGGSAYGLDAAGGVQAWLREQGRGFAIGPVRVPIVSSAILFDLINGGDKSWSRQSPYWELGWEAAEAAAQDFSLGSHGAGTGAFTAGLKGGLGSASMQTDDGIRIGALVAVNAVGRATMGETPHFWAAPFEKNAEFGGLGHAKELPEDIAIPYTKLDAMRNAPTGGLPTGLGGNTTIGIIATDAKLTKPEAKRLAIMAHTGFARALWPSHSPMDGDLIFALSTGSKDLPNGDDGFGMLGAHGAATMARAIARGVYEATPAPEDPFPTWRAMFSS
ncbi:L-aminopeptidase/D-esterase [Cohaesibacter sp. ES.047]|uniref:P1 family peptidase n=1 Tax=Cohaesibacter sp. ES.047 TaxID=1798205 RepID=UPI000BB8C95E|nr:P1 family peptidase [Cohaesibacter sp. ES.047]SNY94212.1 L-aminopeptidase/D-esterase [Cohaesibacter sp. ES.047]